MANQMKFRFMSEYQAATKRNFEAKKIRQLCEPLYRENDRQARNARTFSVTDPLSHGYQKTL